MYKFIPRKFDAKIFDGSLKSLDWLIPDISRIVIIDNKVTFNTYNSNVEAKTGDYIICEEDGNIFSISPELFNFFVTEVKDDVSDINFDDTMGYDYKTEHALDDLESQRDMPYKNYIEYAENFVANNEYMEE